MFKRCVLLGLWLGLIVSCSSHRAVESYVGHLDKIYELVMDKDSLAAGLGVKQYVLENQISIDNSLTELREFNIERVKEFYPSIESRLKKFRQLTETDPPVYPSDVRDFLSNYMKENKESMIDKMIAEKQNNSELFFMHRIFAPVAVKIGIIQQFSKANPLKNYNLKRVDDFKEAAALMGFSNLIEKDGEY